jgi:hypothetical protein
MPLWALLRELIELLAIKSLVKDTKSTLSFYFISLTFPTNIFPFFEKHLRLKLITFLKQIAILGGQSAIELSIRAISQTSYVSKTYDFIMQGDRFFVHRCISQDKELPDIGCLPDIRCLLVINLVWVRERFSIILSCRGK